MQKGKLAKLNFRSNKLKSQKKNFSTGGTMLAIKTASILWTPNPLFGLLIIVPVAGWLMIGNNEALPLGPVDEVRDLVRDLPGIIPRAFLDFNGAFLRHFTIEDNGIVEFRRASYLNPPTGEVWIILIEGGVMLMRLLALYFQSILASSAQGQINPEIIDIVQNLRGFMFSIHSFIFIQVAGQQFWDLNHLSPSELLELFNSIMVNTENTNNGLWILSSNFLQFISRIHFICEPENYQALYELCRTDNFFSGRLGRFVTFILSRRFLNVPFSD